MYTYIQHHLTHRHTHKQTHTYRYMHKSISHRSLRCCYSCYYYQKLSLAISSCPTSLPPPSVYSYPPSTLNKPYTDILPVVRKSAEFYRNTWKNRKVLLAVCLAFLTCVIYLFDFLLQHEDMPVWLRTLCVCVCVCALNLENIYIKGMCKHLGPVQVRHSKYPLLFIIIGIIYHVIKISAVGVHQPESTLSLSDYHVQEYLQWEYIIQNGQCPCWHMLPKFLQWECINQNGHCPCWHIMLLKCVQWESINWNRHCRCWQIMLLRQCSRSAFAGVDIVSVRRQVLAVAFHPAFW